MAHSVSRWRLRNLPTFCRSAIGLSPLSDLRSGRSRRRFSSATLCIPDVVISGTRVASDGRRGVHFADDPPDQAGRNIGAGGTGRTSGRTRRRREDANERRLPGPGSSATPPAKISSAVVCPLHWALRFAHGIKLSDGLAAAHGTGVFPQHNRRADHAARLRPDRCCVLFEADAETVERKYPVSPGPDDRARHCAVCVVAGADGPDPGNARCLSS